MNTTGQNMPVGLKKKRRLSSRDKEIMTNVDYILKHGDPTGLKKLYAIVKKCHRLLEERRG